MNIRFDKGSIRCRVSQEEAKKLSSARELNEIFMFPGGFHLSVCLNSQSDDLKVVTGPSRILYSVPVKQLMRLLDPSTKKDAAITVQLEGHNGDFIEAIFEVDLFSFKGSKKKP